MLPLNLLLFVHLRCVSEYFNAFTQKSISSTVNITSTKANTRSYYKYSQLIGEIIHIVWLFFIIFIIGQLFLTWQCHKTCNLNLALLSPALPTVFGFYLTTLSPDRKFKKPKQNFFHNLKPQRGQLLAKLLSAARTRHVAGGHWGMKSVSNKRASFTKKTKPFLLTQCNLLQRWGSLCDAVKLKYNRYETWALNWLQLQYTGCSGGM